MDELSDTETYVMSTKSMPSWAMQSARDDSEDAEQPLQQQISAVKSGSVRFHDDLESVHHFEVPSKSPSEEEAVLSHWERTTGERDPRASKSNSEELRRRTLDHLRDLRDADKTRPDYDPTWD